MEKKYNCFEDEEMCMAEFPLSESLYGNCLDVYIEGSVNSIPTKTDRKVCDHVPPNNTGKIHRPVLTRTKTHIRDGA